MIRSQWRNWGGLILIIVGVILLMENFNIDVWEYVWPLAIILIGVYLIVRAGRRSESQSKLSEFRVLGDSRHPGFTGEIDGTDISHIIGDVELNLVGTQLKSGINKLKISMLIGDVKIVIPDGMAVSASCSVAFGDIRVFDRKEDGIFLTVRHNTPDYDTAEKKLRISCSAFIGDIVIVRPDAVSSA